MQKRETCSKTEQAKRPVFVGEAGVIVIVSNLARENILFAFVCNSRLASSGPCAETEPISFLCDSLRVKLIMDSVGKLARCTLVIIIGFVVSTSFLVFHVFLY